MLSWSWLKEINLSATATILSDETNKRFYEADYKKHHPQKLLKPFLIDIIENHQIDVFIIPIMTKFQIAAGSVLSSLKKQYPYIRIVIFKFNDLNNDFSGEYLHIAWQLNDKAYILQDASIDNEKSSDQIKQEVVEYLALLNTALITEDLDVAKLHSFRQIKTLKLDIEDMTTNTEDSDVECLPTLLSQQEELNEDTEDGLLVTDGLNTEQTLKRIKKIKRKIQHTLEKADELTREIEQKYASVDRYMTELQRLENKIKFWGNAAPQVDGKGEAVRDIHTGLFGKYVLWPVGYCKNHNCGLDEIDIIKRKCILRWGRTGICFHFEFIDGNGNTIEVDKALFADRNLYK